MNVFSNTKVPFYSGILVEVVDIKSSCRNHDLIVLKTCRSNTVDDYKYVKIKIMQNDSFNEANVLIYH